jgi:hypothetical protein
MKNSFTTCDCDFVAARVAEIATMVHAELMQTTDLDKLPGGIGFVRGGAR